MDSPKEKTPLKNILQATDLSKKFGNTKALQNINMKLQEGISLILGPNGSGKSTLLKISLGLLKPTSGKIEILGKDPWKEGLQVKKDIGVVYEKVTLPKWVSGINYLKFAARTKEMSNIKNELDGIGKLFDIDSYYQGDMRTYSAGMLQKIALAQAFLGKPKLIILDEPTTNLDTQARKRLAKIIKDYRERYETNFVVSAHFLTELEELCNQIAVLYNGRIIEQGTLKDLKMKYFSHVYRIETEEPIKTVEHLHKMNSVKKVTLEGKSIFVETFKESELEKDISILKERGIKLTIFEKHPSIRSLYGKILELGQTRQADLEIN